MRRAVAILLVLSGWASAVTPAAAQSPLDQSVTESIQVLREIMAIPLKAIPQGLLDKAQGVAILPGLKKGGLIIGMEHGKGLFVTRDDNGRWRAPVFITLTGASIGLQAGVESTDLVLVFMTKESVDRTLKGRVNIGTDLSASAGPIGRDALVATDGPIKADVLSYSRSRGLFAGLALSGATIHVDFQSNSTYYSVRPGQMQPILPASAIALAQALASYDRAPDVAPAAAVPANLAAPVIAQPDERETLRQQLVAAALRLQALLDPAWQKYLALPKEVFTGESLPQDTSFDLVLQHFRAVTNDPRYWVLNERPEFQEAQTLLRRYSALSQPGAAGTLSLPPPPAN